MNVISWEKANMTLKFKSKISNKLDLNNYIPISVEKDDSRRIYGGNF